MNQDKQHNDIQAGLASGFHGHVGHRLIQWEQDLAVLELHIQDHHLNRGGVLHGGVLATLVDAAGGFSGSYSADPAVVIGVITLNLNVSFTGQISSGRVRAVARRRAGGRRIFFASVDVYGPGDELIAMGEGTFRQRSSSQSQTSGDD